MSQSRKVAIFSKPTEFNTINLSGGGTYTSDNAELICVCTLTGDNGDVIESARALAKAKGFELGNVQEVAMTDSGHYAQLDIIYEWDNVVIPCTAYTRKGACDTVIRKVGAQDTHHSVKIRWNNGWRWIISLKDV